MKMSPAPPPVKDNEWYNTTDTIAMLGISRTTFWRKANAGMIKRRLRKVDNNWWYQGREILRFYNSFI